MPQTTGQRRHNRLSSTIVVLSPRPASVCCSALCAAWRPKPTTTPIKSRDRRQQRSGVSLLSTPKSQSLCCLCVSAVFCLFVVLISFVDLAVVIVRYIVERTLFPTCWVRCGTSCRNDIEVRLLLSSGLHSPCRVFFVFWCFVFVPLWVVLLHVYAGFAQTMGAPEHSWPDWPLQ